MRKTVKRAIEEYGLIKGGDHIVCALSGGADSVALLHCLYTLQKELDFQLFAAHLNHKIRGKEADEDQEFAVTLCNSLSIDLYLQQRDVLSLAKERKQGIEVVARQERYDFFDEAKQHFDAQAVAVAHHSDDQAETVLLHLLRGSGLTGLVGMRPKRGDIIRPLLQVSKEEILHYIKDNGLSYRTDSTNLARSAVRNRLRLDVIPYLKDHVNHDVTRALCTAAELIRQDEDFLTGLAKEALFAAKIGNGYDRKAIAKLEWPIRSRALRLALMEAGIKENVEKVHIDMLCDLLHAKTGTCIALPGIEALVSYDILYLGGHVAPEPIELPFVLQGDTVTPRGIFKSRIVEGSNSFCREKSVGCMDFDRLPDSLVIRSRRNGDRIRLVGAPGDKKLKDLFIDRKVPRLLREVPMLCSGSRVLFLPGHGIDESVKVTEQTRRMLWVEYCEN